MSCLTESHFRKERKQNKDSWLILTQNPLKSAGLSTNVLSYQQMLEKTPKMLV